MKAHSKVPLVTKLTQADSLSDTGSRMLTQDIFASNLYEAIITNKFKLPFVNEYEQSIVIL